MTVSTCLSEVQHAELGFLSELPLALCVCIVQLSRQFLWVFVLFHGLRLISKAYGLGSAEANRRRYQGTNPSSCDLMTHFV